MLRFLQLRAIPGVEIVADESYSRVIELPSGLPREFARGLPGELARGLPNGLPRKLAGEHAAITGSIHVSHAPKHSALRVIVRYPRLSALPTIIARIRRMFDLSAEPTAIASALSSDPLLAPLVSTHPGLRVPGAWDPFEIAVRAILGQQITLKAATQFAARIVSAIGSPVTATIEIPGLTHAFPSPDRFNLKALYGIGITTARAKSIAGIAAAAIADPRLFDPRRDLPEAVARLRQLPGVGEWTAQYIAMRALGETDAFLAADVALQRKFNISGRRPTVPELLDRADRWRPWRAYAMLHLWMSDARQPHAPLLLPRPVRRERVGVRVFSGGGATCDCHPTQTPNKLYK
jgi:AraC family transcriptional regulator of adaptative response / DNA-3-methyladenine glycosylase II